MTFRHLGLILRVEKEVMRVMSAATRKHRRGFWLGFAAGAVAMFIFDPSADEGRRIQISNQLRGVVARGRRHLVRLARYAWSEGEGAGKRVMHRHPAAPVDDLALLDRIQSEIYRDPAVPKGSFNLEVVKGEVFLRGQLPDAAAIERVVNSVKAVDGVGSVRSLLHVTGTPAPNKEDAIEASAATP